MRALRLLPLLVLLGALFGTAAGCGSDRCSATENEDPCYPEYEGDGDLADAGPPRADATGTVDGPAVGAPAPGAPTRDVAPAAPGRDRPPDAEGRPDTGPCGCAADELCVVSHIAACDKITTKCLKKTARCTIPVCSPGCDWDLCGAPPDAGAVTGPGGIAIGPSCASGGCPTATLQPGALHCFSIAPAR